MFKCPYCDYTSISLSNLRVHVRKEHVFITPCPYCIERKPFKYKLSKRYHRKAYLISSTHARKIITYNRLLEHLLMYYLCIKSPYKNNSEVKLLKELGYQISLVLLKNDEGGL